jgi:small subunit ribosomal protein S14
MAKKSAIARNEKRKKLAAKFAVKRVRIKTDMKGASLEKRMQLQMELNKLPNNAAPCRVRNRCEITGRTRGFYRKFRMSRNMLRQFAMFGQIPGITKSSW